jgi:hypothetical protein
LDEGLGYAGVGETSLAVGFAEIAAGSSMALRLQHKQARKPRGQHLHGSPTCSDKVHSYASRLFQTRR